MWCTEQAWYQPDAHSCPWLRSGLADHLEDVYLEVLEAAAQKSAEKGGSLKSALDTLGEELEANHTVSA